MKTRHILFLSFAAMALTACEKDSQPSDGNLHLVVEGMGGSKMAISGNHSYWVTDDKVNINGSEYTLSVSGSASDAVVDVPAAENYYGGYPSDICAVDADLGTCTLAVPAEYTYETVSYNSGTYQHLQSPLVGYAASGADRMIFKHVTAAIGVQVVNYYGFTIEVDSIVVVSDSYKLNGSVAVDLSGSDPTVSATAAVNDAEKKVKMLGGSSLRIFAGDSTVVQIPVLPVGSGNHFTVRTYVHKVDQTAVVKTLEKTQTTGGALARKQIGYARMTTPGLFSVSATKKVVISQGNLQWGHNTWRFALNQYDYVGNATNNTSPTTNDENWMDLFCWGANGNTVDPNLSASYNNSTADVSGTNNDWWYCNISNGGGNERWRSMVGGTSGEWKYLLETRSVSSNYYAKATINSKQGIIIFPDMYNHPTGEGAPAAVVSANSKTASYTANEYTKEQWYLIEAEGAVFLPSSGQRNGSTVSNVGGDVYYWTSTPSSADNSRIVYLTNSSFDYASSWRNSAKKYGNPVRLVREVE